MQLKFLQTVVITNPSIFLVERSNRNFWSGAAVTNRNRNDAMFGRKKEKSGENILGIKL